jgi:hypothetical protein
MVYFLTHLPLKKYTSVHTLRDVAVKLSEKLVKEKSFVYEQGLEGSKDLMSLLVRANVVEKEGNKLSDLDGIHSEVEWISSSSPIYHMNLPGTSPFTIAAREHFFL